MGKREFSTWTTTMNRLAATGGRFTDAELEDWHDRQDQKEGVVAGDDEDVDGVDINPANYIASAATGAFGGILKKADEDLEDVQRQLRKKKKKKKKHVEAEPEVVEEPPPPPPAQPQITRISRDAFIAMQPWHRRYRNYLYAAGGAVAALVIGPRLLRR